MQFAEMVVAQAEGAILAHSVAVAGQTFKKGRILSAQDIAILLSAGRHTVFAARLSPDDVAEDEAASGLAQALAGANVRVAAPFTGRANLYASSAGILTFDAVALARVNGVHESLTVATLAPHERVAADQMIATVKIIPFAVERRHFEAASAAAASGARMRVAAFEPRRVGLVLTELAGTRPAVLAKRADAIAVRLSGMGSGIAHSRTVAHEPAAVAAALKDLASLGASPLMVFAASAIVDRADVIPAGLVAAGGHIERLGMPVDPGNLLLLGDLRGTPVIGIPSCAASPKLNGFDWVLERVLAGLPVDGDAVAAMGIGGLLKEIVTRPQPRDGQPAQRSAPRIAALILAAGRSTRMGANKLLEQLGGRPIVRHVVEAASAAANAHVLVVTGHQAEAVRAALDGTTAAFVHNPDYARGLSASLKAGLAALPADIDGAIVMLGDMPEITSAHLARLIAAFSPADGRTIVVPTRSGKRGNPVLWGRQHFAAMRETSGDTGAKHLIGQLADQVAEVDLGSDAIFADIDTPDALAALRQRADHSA